MKVRLVKSSGFAPCSYVLLKDTAENLLLWHSFPEKLPPDATRLFQLDWDFPSLASMFGFVPCDCGLTDGTIECEHKIPHEMIASAIEFLDEHCGDVAEDIGYFDGLFDHETYTIVCKDTGERQIWTLKQILYEINRDHSSEWQNYDESDWREGWDEWCEGDFYHLES
jgi:hypothetical protein